MYDLLQIRDVPKDYLMFKQRFTLLKVRIHSETGQN